MHRKHWPNGSGVCQGVGSGAGPAIFLGRRGDVTGWVGGVVLRGGGARESGRSAPQVCSFRVIVTSWSGISCKTALRGGAMACIGGQGGYPMCKHGCKRSGWGLALADYRGRCGVLVRFLIGYQDFVD